MPNALPILLLGGAALMMMGGKKKKKPAESSEEESYPEESIPEEEIPTSTLLAGESMLDRCNKFIDAVWVEPEPGSAAIKDLVVEETVIPEMTAAAKQKRKEKGEDLSEDFSNTLVMIGLNSIAPNCGWVLTGDGWRYADGNHFEGKVLDIYNSMRSIALEVINQVNSPAAETVSLGEPPPPKPEEPGGLKFDIGD